MPETNTTPGASRGPAPSGPGARAGWRRSLALLVLGFAVLLGLHTQGTFIRLEWSGFALALLGSAAACVALWMRSGRPRPGSPARHAPLLALFALTVVCLFSSVTRHKWFYFLGWAPPPSGLLRSSGLMIFTALAIALTPLFLARPMRRPWMVTLLVLVGSQALCVAGLWAGTGGSALYRIDHPSFMLRLWEFTRHFPQLVNYMPQWNAGVLHEASVLTGVAGPGLVLWPLLRFFPVHDVYTPAWALLFLVIAPWIGVASVRAIGGDRTAAFAGGVLALGVSQHFFLWALHYGTLGASFASVMAMPVCALGFRIVWMDGARVGTCLALVASGFLLLMWPPCGLVAVAAALATLASADRWTWRNVGILALCAAGILALFSPWIVAILAEGQAEMGLVTKAAAPSGAPGAAGLAMARLQSGARHLAAHAQEFHPLLIFFGVLGVAGGVSRPLRRWYLPILILLVLVTGWSREFMPRSQLSRISIPLCFCAVPPAALFLGRLLRLRDRRMAFARAAVVALLVCTGLNVAALCRNRGRARYAVLPPYMEQLVGWIRAHTPPDARVLFAGECVHGYGGGNVAYLPVLTGRAMMAGDYYGFAPELVEYEYPPRPFRESFDGLLTFLDAYNVSHILTYHDEWKAFLRERPEAFAEEASFENVTVFSRSARPGLFRKGSGRIAADVNRLDVTLDDPQAVAVLAYNWIDGLQAPSPVELFPFTLTEGIVLIGVRPHGQTRFTIRFEPGLTRRAWQNLTGEKASARAD
jgi:hypothetical protein